MEPVIVTIKSETYQTVTFNNEVMYPLRYSDDDYGFTRLVYDAGDGIGQGAIGITFMIGI